MALNVGVHDISQLLAVRNASVAEYGLDTIQRTLEAELAAHNAIVEEMVSDLCEVTTDRQRVYGTAGQATEMVEVDEYGKPQSQRQRVGSTCGFPMKSFQYALGWTQKWFENYTPADMAEQVQSAEMAHLRMITREIKRACFLSANFTFYDHLVDNVALAVKRFVNADGAGIPAGPNGETFDGSTHTHYDAHAGWDAATLLAEINDVVEHGHGASVRCVINRSNEATVAALTGFNAYSDPRLIYRASDTPGATLDISRIDNRAIGLFGAAEVWVKPWAISDYPLVYDAAATGKPLVYRQRVGRNRGLRIVAEIAAYPLYAKIMEAEFGIGVWTRTNGAVTYMGGGAYVDPTIS